MQQRDRDGEITHRFRWHWYCFASWRLRALLHTTRCASVPASVPGGSGVSASVPACIPAASVAAFQHSGGERRRERARAVARSAEDRPEINAVPKVPPALSNFKERNSRELGMFSTDMPWNPFKASRGLATIVDLQCARCVTTGQDIVDMAADGHCCSHVHRLS